MTDHQLNYAQITAATRQVIHVQDLSWQRTIKTHECGHETFRDVAMGAYLLWMELTAGRQLESDHEYLHGMVMAFGIPLDQR